MPRPEGAPISFSEQSFSSSSPDYESGNNRPEIPLDYIQPQLEVFDPIGYKPAELPIESTFFWDPVAGKVIEIERRPKEPKIPEAA